MGLQWHDEAWEDYIYWQSQDKKTLNKINKLLKDIRRNPYEGIGKPEALTGDLSGWWSRRIDEKNRIIYRQQGEHIVIAECKSHYDER